MDIFNRALSRIGTRRISDPTEDSPAARACTAAWEMVRDEVLRAHPWNCVTARASLAADVVEPEYEYDYAYVLPTTCMRVLEVENWGLPWVVEGRRILTDATAPLTIRFIERVEDTQQYDPLLVSAIVQRLAAELAQELISASGPQQEQFLQVYKRLLAQARAVDGMESSPQELEMDVWLAVRF